MRVICPRCRTEYEFDTARVSQDGTRVKCSSCQNIFTVYPPDVVSATAEGRESRRDLAATGAGPSTAPSILLAQGERVYRVRDLATLQRWIIEKRVLATDRVAMDGDEFEVVADRPELRPFLMLLEQLRETRRELAKERERISSISTAPVTGSEPPTHSTAEFNRARVLAALGEGGDADAASAPAGAAQDLGAPRAPVPPEESESPTPPALAAALPRPAGTRGEGARSGGASRNSGSYPAVGGSAGRNSGSYSAVGGSAGRTSGSYSAVGGPGGRASGSHSAAGGAVGRNSGSYPPVGGAAAGAAGAPSLAKGGTPSKRPPPPPRRPAPTERTDADRGPDRPTPVPPLPAAAPAHVDAEPFDPRLEVRSANRGVAVTGVALALGVVGGVLLWRQFHEDPDPRAEAAVASVVEPTVAAAAPEPAPPELTIEPAEVEPPPVARVEPPPVEPPAPLARAEDPAAKESARAEPDPKAAPVAKLPLLEERPASKLAPPPPKSEPKSGGGGAREEGDRYAASGQHSEAVVSYRKALATAPRDVGLMVKLGWAEVEAGRHADAASTFQQAIRLDSSLAGAHYGLAYSYQKMGDRDRALEEYNTCIGLDNSPNRGDARECTSLRDALVRSP